MTTSQFEAANRLYTFSRGPAFHYRYVEHELFRRFCHQSRRFKWLLGDSAQDIWWARFARDLSRYRFDLSSAPLSFDNPIVAPTMKFDEIQRFVSQTARVYPSLSDATREVADLLLALQRCPDNPLLDELEANLETANGMTAVVVKESRLIAAVEGVLLSRGMAQSCSVVSLSQVRHIEDCARIIVTGALRWYPDHIFAAPRAPEVTVVAFGWYRARWRSESPFVYGRALPVQFQDEVEGEPGGDAANEPWPELDWTWVAQKGAVSLSSGTDASEHELTEARLFALHGGFAVFLEEAEEATSLVIDPDEGISERVKRVGTGRIEPGMYILLRTEGGGDYVAQVADSILGKLASSHRYAQQRWKAALRGVVQRGDVTTVAIELLDLGSTRADEANIRNWISARGIAMRDKEDFTAVMRRIGLEARTDEYWAMMRNIRSAHLKAGRLIRRRLMDQVRATDLRNLPKKGRMDFSLPETEGGKLTAFRVEGRSPTTNRIHASGLDRPFLGTE